LTKLNSRSNNNSSSSESKGRRRLNGHEQAVNYIIETMWATDWRAVRAIYVEGIATGNATFETAAPEWEEWDRAHHRFARLVARRDDRVVGWAALSPVSGRPVYAGVAEVSIYVGQSVRGCGVGFGLLSRLIEEAERNGIWMLQAGILPENEASLALHRRCGFREVGRRERIGRLKGEWRDVVLMERRSRQVGID
jgi:phosphinothricin acetyltransferase